MWKKKKDGQTPFFLFIFSGCVAIGEACSSLSSSSHLLLPDELPIAFSSSFTKSRQLEREIEKHLLLLLLLLARVCDCPSRHFCLSLEMASSFCYFISFIFLGFYLKIEAHGRASKHVRFVDQKTNRKANTIWGGEICYHRLPLIRPPFVCSCSCCLQLLLLLLSVVISLDDVPQSLAGIIIYK
jgi:hypothetical protein